MTEIFPAQAPPKFGYTSVRRITITMKIITWNCNCAFRNKLEYLDQFDADILVIQECENPELSTKAYRSWAGEYLWTGTTKNRGLGVFPKNSNSIQKLNWNGECQIKGLHSKSKSLKWSTPELKLFIPFTINNEITALGAWTKGSNSEAFGYMGQFWKYIQIHHKDLSNKKTLIIGDLNSNKMWDKKDRWWSHSDVVDELSEIGLNSLYHFQKKESQGSETQPTFYLQKNLSKSYHIDYCFVSDDLISNCQIEIGKIEQWVKISDHVPLIISISS